MCGETEEKTNENNQIPEEPINNFASITTKNSRGSLHCITIVGQVEGHMILPPQNKTTKYEHVMPQLAAIEESDEIDGLLILLNTMGGDVEAGLAIAELISGMKTPTVSLVLGGGAFHRRSAGRVGDALLHRSDRIHDDPPRAVKRRRCRCAADVYLF